MKAEGSKEKSFGMASRSSFILHLSSFRDYGAQKHTGS